MKFLMMVCAAVAVPRVAAACLPPDCLPAFFVPGEGAHVPANLPGIVWRAPYLFDSNGQTATPDNVTLTDANGNVIALTVVSQTGDSLRDYVLAPATPLVAGMTYTLADANTCNTTGEPGPTVHFTATAEAPLPTALGDTSSITGVGQLDVATRNGLCTVEITAAYADLSLALDPSAQPWADALLYDTRIDDTGWFAADDLNQNIPPGSSWQGRARDIAYRVCQDPQQGAGTEGLAEGVHAGAFHATLANTALDLTTSGNTFSVNCAFIEDGGPFEDGSGGPPPDGPTNGASGGGGGCCSTSGGNATGALWLAAATLGLVYRRRARVSSKRRSES